jgi:hypothetical protein
MSFFRIYSVTIPEGVLKDVELTPEIVAEIDAKGVWRGGCPCCGKPLVIRYGGERSAMTAGDEHFLLHGGFEQ